MTIQVGPPFSGKAAKPQRLVRRLIVAVAVGMFSLALSAGSAEAFSPIAKGDLIVSEASGQVNEFTPTGTFVQTLIPNAQTPTGSAFDGQGNLYVTEFGANDILKVDGQTGAVSTFSSDTILGDGTVFNSPESIAFGPGFTKMYVSDANRSGPGGGIHVIDPATGKGIGFFKLPSSSGSLGVGESDWLALDPNANLFMTNEIATQGVMKVNQSTGDIVSPSFAGNLPNIGYAMSYDPSGNLWLSDTDRILEYSPSGSLLRTITNPSFSTVFAGVFNPPFNTIYAGDLDTGDIFSYDLNGNLTGSFNVLSGIDGLSVAGTTLPGTGGGLGPPQDLQVFPHNGDIAVSWQPPASGANLVTGYKITATPVYNDRLPMPSASPVSVEVGPNQLTADPSGLLVDCHQLYTISVSALQGTTVGSEAVSDPVRPSGNVASGEDPPYVVILLDGVNESQPGFIENPEQPTADNQPSYCPESVTPSGTESEADFLHAGNGPWSFFHKWNFGEVDNNGNPTQSNPDKTTPNTESMPRARPGNTNGIKVGTDTHSFMLDAIAAQGAIILPFSYSGSDLVSDQRFVYDKYGGLTNGCQSIPGCGPTIQQDAVNLGREVFDASVTWPTSKVVVMGHSQGGLIAFTWWVCAHPKLRGILIKEYCGGQQHQIRTSLPLNFVGAFSLDSPINGACRQLFGKCFGPPSYPTYNNRGAIDPAALALENLQTSFHFIGTFGDSPLTGYQEGSKTLEHQLLFNYTVNTSGGIQTFCSNSLFEGSCPVVLPWDHISDCPVANDPDIDGDDNLNIDDDAGSSGGDDGASLIAPWETPHYVEKYCPGNVRYFNSQLGLSQ